MKLHALMIAAALALAGTAFAQAPYGAPKAPADASASPSAAMSAEKPVKLHKMHKKHVAKAKRSHLHQHASLMRHEHHKMHASAGKHLRHEMHARAHFEHHNTRAMGAGPASPSVDLNSSSRQHRMDLAYNDWLRSQRR